VSVPSVVGCRGSIYKRWGTGHRFDVRTVEDPCTTHRSSFQQQFTVNVWAGIIDNYNTGPYVMQDNMSVFLKKDFNFYSWICRRVCGFSMMVLPSIFHIICEIGFTALQADGLGMEI
jgi:hypothetical protein